MAKDINLTSQEWCDIVFEGKNKEYGAYKIRMTSSRRHIIALIAILIIAIFIAFLPTLIQKVKEATKSISGGLTESTVLAELQDMEDNQVEEVVRPEAPPPPPLKSTIKFTPPVITSSDEMTDDDAMKSQDDLLDSKLTISIADVQGTNDDSGVDIQDLDRHKVIVQEDENVIHDVVEQMPEFPGGMQELNANIKKRLQYPPLAAENRIQGTSVVRFAVMKDGKVDKVQIYASSHPLLDKEAIRVVQTMPKWIPGKINGKPVSCYYIIPIVFILQ